MLLMNRFLRIKFFEITVKLFWVSVQTEFKTIKKKTNSNLYQNCQHRCELRFSILTNIMTKKRFNILS